MIYAFTDKDIADALIKAYNRGVVVKGVFDEDFNTNKYSQYNYLKDNNIDVLVDGNEFLLHDKVMIIDKNIVITGSYNFTLSANNKNAENSLVIISPQIYQKYKNEFFKIYKEGK
jgi:phospholipase D